jgi:hypothetical protein
MFCPAGYRERSYPAGQKKASEDKYLKTLDFFGFML